MSQLRDLRGSSDKEGFCQTKSFYIGEFCYINDFSHYDTPCAFYHPAFNNTLLNRAGT